MEWIFRFLLFKPLSKLMLITVFELFFQRQPQYFPFNDWMLCFYPRTQNHRTRNSFLNVILYKTQSADSSTIQKYDENLMKYKCYNSSKYQTGFPFKYTKYEPFRSALMGVFFLYFMIHFDVPLSATCLMNGKPWYSTKNQTLSEELASNDVDSLIHKKNILMML